VGWQEVNHQPDKAAVKAGMPGYQTVQLDLSVPISIRDDWRIIKAGRHKTHSGRERVTPARWITWVIVERDGMRLTFLNTHLVSGAWNSKKKLAKAWRRLRWTEHETELRKILASLHRDHGPVIFGGDFNRLHVNRLHPQAVWLDNRGIDKIGAIGTTGSTTPQRIRTPSDHDARLVDVQL
jgi:endonuclease/exonuclease/phosphatase (EEP) superfamily protein YafD